MDGPAFLDGLVQSMTGILSGGYSRLAPELKDLFSVIVGLDLILAALAWCAAYLEVFQRFGSAMIKLFVWAMIFTSYPVISQAFVDYCIGGGLLAGGVVSGGQLSVDEFRRPSTVMMKGFEATAPINKFIDNHTGWGMMWNFWTLGALSVGALGIWVAFVVMSLHLVFVQIVMEIVLALGLLFLVFGALGLTSFLAERAIGLIIASAARLGVSALITALMFPFIEQFFLTPGQDPNMYDGAWVLVGSWLIATLSWLIPAIAHGFFSAGPMLSMGNMIPGMGLMRSIGGGSRSSGGGQAGSPAPMPREPVQPAARMTREGSFY